jgi:outer membrane lipoprotein carrier protein
MLPRFLALPAFVLLAIGAAPAQTPPATDLVRRIQARYNTILDFTADFSMTYQGLLQRQKSVERGDVKLKKPSRMWWHYTSPDKKEYVADGSQFYTYVPQDKYGTRVPLAKAGDASTFMLFLAGKGDLVKDFTAAVPPDQTETEWRVVLTPKTHQPDYATLTLAVDRKTLDLRGVTLTSDEGTSTFTFTKFRPNTGLKDSDFVFSFPKGTEIR